jgi:hypothetical protein
MIITPKNMLPDLFNSRMVMKCIIAMLGVCVFVACDDDDDERVVDEPTTDTLDNILQSDEYAYQIVLAGLFNTYDSLYLVPALGAALDEAQPTVYTTGVVDETAARSFFAKLCTVDDRCTLLTDGSIQYNLGTYGSLCYHPFGENGALASLEVNLHEVSTLTRLDFIPQELWPNNEASLFEIGDVVKDKGGNVWVCVQEYGAGLPALFITFSYARASYWDAWPENVRIVYRQCASYEALKAWYSLLKSGHSRFTIGTKENDKLRDYDEIYLGLYDIMLCNDEKYKLYCSGTCVERTAKVSNRLCRDVENSQYHIIAMSSDCGVPVAEDLVFLCTQESKTPLTYRTLLANPEETSNPLFLLRYYWYHTGVVEYGNQTYSLNRRRINKQTYSVSLQDEQIMRSMFTKIN